MSNYLEVFESKLTKSEIKSMAVNVVNNVKESGNPLQVAEALSAMELFIKEVKADEGFKDYVREEISKNEKCFVSKSGAKLELAETGSKYDFSMCGDIEMEMLETEANRFSALLKQRQDFLKTIPQSGLVVTDKESGDTYEIYPPSKTSTSSYKITLAK